MILQSAIFYGTAVYGGILTSLNKNADEILTERVINRKNELETQFNSHWTNLESYSDIINNIYAGYNQQGVPFYEDDEQQKAFLTEVTPTILSILRNNKVNGAFIIINDKKEFEEPQYGETYENYGLCIRDYDVDSAYTDKEDLLVVRCPSAMIKTIGCSLETWWDAKYSFDGSSSSDFYFKPLQAAYDNPNVGSDNLAYFAVNHRYQKDDKSVVSFSLPLIDENGHPYAVLGIELTTDYLKSLLPSDELYGQNNGSYAFVTYEESNPNVYNVLTQSGSFYQRAFGKEDRLFIDSFNETGVFSDSTEDIEVRGSTGDLNIYNKNTPFEHTHLALAGMTADATMYGMSSYIKQMLFIVAIIVLVIGMGGIFVVSRRFAMPITRLLMK